MQVGIGNYCQLGSDINRIPMQKIVQFHEGKYRIAFNVTNVKKHWTDRDVRYAFFSTDKPIFERCKSKHGEIAYFSAKQGDSVKYSVDPT